MPEGGVRATEMVTGPIAPTAAIARSVGSEDGFSGPGGPPTAFWGAFNPRAGEHWALNRLMWKALGRQIKRCKPRKDLFVYPATLFFAGVGITALVGWISILGSAHQPVQKALLGILAVMAVVAGVFAFVYERLRVDDALERHAALKQEYKKITKAMHDEEEARKQAEAVELGRASAGGTVVMHAKEAPPGQA